MCVCLCEVLCVLCASMPKVSLNVSDASRVVNIIHYTSFIFVTQTHRRRTTARLQKWTEDIKEFWFWLFSIRCAYYTYSMYYLYRNTDFITTNDDHRGHHCAKWCARLVGLRRKQRKALCGLKTLVRFVARKLIHWSPTILCGRPISFCLSSCQAALIAVIIWLSFIPIKICFSCVLTVPLFVVGDENE